MGEAEGAARLGQLGELFGAVVARHRQVLGRGPQVLAEREDRHADVDEVAHRREQLGALFAETEDDPRLGRQGRRRGARAAEQLERALVPAAVARHAIEPRHGLGVVIEDVGPGVDHGRERGGIALKVRNEHLDAAARGVVSHGAHRGGPVRGAAVGEVVAVDRGDHDVLEAEIAHGARNPLGLLAILPGRTAVGDRAVAAVPRAHVAEDHERRRRVFPALADVRTVRFFTHRVQVGVAHQALEPQIIGSAGGAYLQPRRLAFADLDDGKLHAHSQNRIIMPRRFSRRTNARHAPRPRWHLRCSR